MCAVCTLSSVCLRLVFIIFLAIYGTACYQCTHYVTPATRRPVVFDHFCRHRCHHCGWVDFPNFRETLEAVPFKLHIIDVCAWENIWLQRSKFELATFYGWEAPLRKKERMWFDRLLDPLWPWTMTLTLDFQSQIKKTEYKYQERELQLTRGGDKSIGC